MQNNLSQILTLIKKEIVLEWRQKYALNGMMLYVASTVFIVYMTFAHVEAKNWISLFWIIVLFAAVNANAKSFLQESTERMLYYYFIASPGAIILSKTIYNFLLLLVLTLLTYGVFALIIANPVENGLEWIFIMILGSASFSFLFTFISSIASKARSNATLMAVLGFPVVLPQIALLIKITKEVLISKNLSITDPNLIALVAIDLIILVVAYMLFPYLWRE